MTPRFAAESSPFLIAGPCVVESDDLNVRVGEALAELADKLGISVIYKASYDKANRSRLNAPRGPGLDAGVDLYGADFSARRSGHKPSVKRLS